MGGKRDIQCSRSLVSIGDLRIEADRWPWNSGRDEGSGEDGIGGFGGFLLEWWTGVNKDLRVRIFMGELGWKPAVGIGFCVNCA